VQGIAIIVPVFLSVSPLAYLNKNQLSLTNPRDTLRHDERAANK